MITFHHLGAAFYEPAFEENGQVFQPALWVPIGGYVCTATKSEHKELGFTRAIRVLAKNEKAWRPGVDPVGSEQRSKWRIDDKNVILAKELKLMVVYVTAPTHKLLRGESRLDLGSGSPVPKKCRLFVAASEFHVFSKDEGKVDPRIRHWLDQSGWNGEGGHYARGRRVEDLKDGWNPDQQAPKIKL